jgi:hypothetical protein
MFRKTLLALTIATLSGGAAMAAGQPQAVGTENDGKPVATLSVQADARGEHNTRISQYGETSEGFRQVAVVANGASGVNDGR